MRMGKKKNKSKEDSLPFHYEKVKDKRFFHIRLFNMEKPFSFILENHKKE